MNLEIITGQRVISWSPVYLLCKPELIGAVGFCFLCFTKWLWKSISTGDMTTTGKLIQGFHEHPWETDISLLLITPGKGVLFIRGTQENATMLWKKKRSSFFFFKAVPIYLLWALKNISNKTRTTYYQLLCFSIIW